MPKFQFVGEFGDTFLTKQFMQGTVKFFNEAKGFGFIKPSGAGEDIFVHSSGLIDKVKENDKVEYEEQRGKKGMNAVNVRLLKS